jgi:Cu-Zn family superoxide dismutase
MDKQNYYTKYIKYKNKYLNSNLKDFSNKIKAISFFNGEKIKGIVSFSETDNGVVLVEVNLEGFEPNTIHGFHVHESGDLSMGCDSMCAHFNPYNQIHGGREDKLRHVGDLGNLEADSEGKVNLKFTDTYIKLRGNEANIIGRGLVIHADPDDCGKGNYSDSKITGHAGKRIGCAIIGYASVCNKNKH